MGAGGGISIGNHVQMGPMVCLIAENHGYQDANRRIDEQPLTHRGIKVEDDCWIGAGAIIMDGVHVGQGSVIGAGAVVTKDVHPYSVVVGNPARLMGRRLSSRNT
jgi:acetyltransferase-like isoleucine patch superfamily enzyme